MYVLLLQNIYFKLIQNEKLTTKGLSLPRWVKIQSGVHSTFTEYRAPEIVIEAGGSAPALVPRWALRAGRDTGPGKGSGRLAVLPAAQRPRPGPTVPNGPGQTAAALHSSKANRRSQRAPRILVPTETDPCACRQTRFPQSPGKGRPAAPLPLNSGPSSFLWSRPHRVPSQRALALCCATISLWHSLHLYEAYFYVQTPAPRRPKKVFMSPDPLSWYEDRSRQKIANNNGARSIIRFSQRSLGCGVTLALYKF